MAENEESVSKQFYLERFELIAVLRKYQDDMEAYWGIITKIENGPTESPEDTTLKIERDGDGHEFTLTGLKAYNAVTQSYHCTKKHQEVPPPQRRTE